MSSDAPNITMDPSTFSIDGRPGPYQIRDLGDEKQGDITKVTLRLGEGGSFCWKETLEVARNVENWILWEIDFPPIALEVTGKNIRFEQEKLLAVTHFSEEIYPEFRGNSVGLLFHKGPLDFGLPQEKRQRALEQFLSRLALFAGKMPDTLPLFLLFDVGKLPVSEAISLLHQKYFGHFPLILRGASFGFPCFSWCRGGGLYGAYLPAEKLGLLVPSTPFEELLQELQTFPYRILYKEFANNDWFGLDAIVFEENTPLVRRILQGFQAAGGRILSRSGNLGIPGEEKLDQYLEERNSG
ncbi:MAG: hypothetical protein AAGF04_05075 [Chlamydiota bacterium]